RIMRVGPPQVGERAAELWVEPSPLWMPLVLYVRSAAASAGLATDRLHPSTRPHVALGYGTGDGDSGVLPDARKRVPHPLVEDAVQELHLASVHYTPGGTFTWDSLARIPLPGPGAGLRSSQVPRPGDMGLD